MKEYLIDFTGVKNYDDLHDALSQGFNFPPYYGRNMDALWDLLTGWIASHAVIYLKGLNKLPDKLKEKKTVMLELFQELHDHYENHPYGDIGSYEIKIIDD